MEWMRSVVELAYLILKPACSLHSKNRLLETTKTLVDMCLTKLLVKITHPSLVNYKCLTNHIG